MFKELLSRKKQIQELYAIVSSHREEMADAYLTIEKLTKELKAAKKAAPKTTKPATKKASK